MGVLPKRVVLDMPQVSKRALATPSSPIRKLAGFATAAKERGTQVFHLNIGQPDVASPEPFWQAVKNTEIKTLEYTHSAGISELREAAVDQYAQYGLSITSDEVLVTSGASEATQFLFLTLMDPGDEAIICEPFYANYTTFAQMAGVHLVPLTTRIEDDFALPSIEAIEAKITVRTKAIVICNPSNPTGTGFTREKLDALAELAIRHDLFLVADEVYRDFYYDGDAPVSILSLPHIEDRAIVLDSVSKRFSLCGARIGYFISRNPEIIANALKYGQARLCAPTLEQIGVVAAIKSTPQDYFRQVKDEYRRRRDIVVSALSSMPGVLCPKIDGAFYAVVRLPIDDSDKFCQWLLTDFSYRGKTIMLSPASGFYATPGLGQDEVRIAYVLEAEHLSEAMECLAQALETYPARVMNV